MFDIQQLNFNETDETVWVLFFFFFSSYCLEFGDSWMCIFKSLIKFGKFLFIVFSNILSVPFYFFLLLGFP